MVCKISLPLEWCAEMQAEINGVRRSVDYRKVEKKVV